MAAIASWLGFTALVIANDLGATVGDRVTAVSSCTLLEQRLPPLTPCRVSSQQKGMQSRAQGSITEALPEKSLNWFTSPLGSQQPGWGP